MKPRTWGERWDVARHEAGHAVAAATLNVSFRYLTLAPRHPAMAGAVMVCRPPRRTRSEWEPLLIVSAAGMAAAAMSTGIRYSRRRQIIADGGWADTRMLRDWCRNVWEHAQLGGHLAPAIDPDWTVADIAAHVWRRAVDLVDAHWPAVGWVADAALSSDRAITQAQVRQMVAGAEPGPAGDVPDRDKIAEWWLPKHTRLRWDIPESRVVNYPRWRAQMAAAADG